MTDRAQASMLHGIRADRIALCSDCDFYFDQIIWNASCPLCHSELGVWTQTQRTRTLEKNKGGGYTPPTQNRTN